MPKQTRNKISSRVSSMAFMKASRNREKRKKDKLTSIKKTNLNNWIVSSAMESMLIIDDNNNIDNENLYLTGRKSFNNFNDKTLNLEIQSFKLINENIKNFAFSHRFCIDR